MPVTQSLFLQQRETLQQHVSWAQLTMPRALDRVLWAEKLPLDRLAQSGTVISGPNSAGKTTLIKALRQRGLECFDSPTRLVNEKAAELFPSSVAHMHSDVLNQTASSFHMAAIRDLCNDLNQPVVFDRGLGDIHGMLRLYRWFSNPITRTLGRPLRVLFSDPALREIVGAGIGSPEAFSQTTQQLRCIEEWAKIVRYRRVLFLDPLPVYRADGIRTEDRRLSTVLSWFIKSSWRKLGYEVIPVRPYFDDVESKTEHVLQIIGAVSSSETRVRDRMHV